MILMLVGLLLVLKYSRISLRELYASSDGGALMQLRATGPQDQYLTGTPPNEIFKPCQNTTDVGANYPDAFISWDSAPFNFPV